MTGSAFGDGDAGLVTEDVGDTARLALSSIFGDFLGGASHALGVGLVCDDDVDTGLGERWSSDVENGRWGRGPNGAPE